jgi:hypothetical protein
MKLRPDGVGRDVRHDIRVHLIAPFALFDPLLICVAPIIIEGDNPRRRTRQVVTMNPTRGAKLARMPLDLGDHLDCWPIANSTTPPV